MREGWEIKKLADLCKTFADGDWIEKKDQSPSGIRLVQTGNVGNGVFRGKDDSRHYISQETFERLHCTEIFPGDILISRLPEPVGRGCLIPETGEKMITAVDCTIIRLNSGCLPKFLVYYSQSAEYQFSVREVSTGTTRQRISRKNLGEIGIPVPSLPEQQRIVDILDREFAGIDALKANAEKSLQAAKDLFQATLKKELEPKEGWISATLGKLYDVRDGTHDSPKYVSEGYPFITSKNLKDGKVDMSDVKFISQNDYEKINERSKVDIGDVLFAMIGSNLGHPAIVEEEPNYAIKNVALFKVPPSQSSRLLLFLLSSDKIMEVMNKEKNGSSQPFVSLKYLRNFVVSIPETRNEQENLAMSIQSISDRHKQLQQNYQKTLTLCDDLKQSLLRKAFSGEL